MKRTLEQQPTGASASNRANQQQIDNYFAQIVGTNPQQTVGLPHVQGGPPLQQPQPASMQIEPAPQQTVGLSHVQGALPLQQPQPASMQTESAPHQTVSLPHVQDATSLQQPQPASMQTESAPQQINLEEIWANATWYREQLLQFCEPQVLPDYVTNDLPEDPQALVETYGWIYQTYNLMSQSQTQSAELEQWGEEGQTAIETNKEEQNPPPKSKAKKEDINKELNGLVLSNAEKKNRGRSIKLTEEFDPKQIDWQASRNLVLHSLSAFKVSSDNINLWQRLTCWNAFVGNNTSAGDFDIDDLQISREEAGLSTNFQLKSEDSGQNEEKPLTQTFAIDGESYTLTEREGVKGGFHAIFDAPRPVTDKYGPALIRAPRDANASVEQVKQGMANYQKVAKLFSVPKIHNKAAQDGFYIVEKINGDFDLENEDHRKAVAEAFKSMVDSGPKFPFDLRVDNIKFKDNKLVVIDFSESGGLGGDVDFWKDSLIEFCWLKTKNKPLLEQPTTSKKSLLEQLLIDADKCGRLPSMLSKNPADYDTQVFSAIWSKLSSEQQAQITSTLQQ
jgi:hypothetical protein